MTGAQFFLTAIGAAAAAHALQRPVRTLVGTFEGFVNGGLNLPLKADNGKATLVETGAAAEVKRVAPGERSLQDAQDLGPGQPKCATGCPSAIRRPPASQDGLSSCLLPQSRAGTRLCAANGTNMASPALSCPRNRAPSALSAEGEPSGGRFVPRDNVQTIPRGLQ